MAIKIALVFLNFALLVTTSQYCSECSLPWQSFRGFCYLLIDVSKSFLEAEGYCKSLSRQGRDAHLVSVTDAQEEAFIEEYADPFGEHEIRIGFILNETTDDYYWVDGTKPGYIDWADDEPSSNKGENCAILKEGENWKWTDRQCNWKYPFICKVRGKYGYTK